VFSTCGVEPAMPRFRSTAHAHRAARRV